MHHNARQSDNNNSYNYYSLCKQANSLKFLNHNIIRTLGQRASNQLNNIYPRKVKKYLKTRKSGFGNIILLFSLAYTTWWQR